MGWPGFQRRPERGRTLVDVNGVPCDPGVLKDALVAVAGPGTAAIELLAKAANRYRTIKLDYHGGLRYPKLERTGSGAGAADATVPNERKPLQITRPAWPG